MNIAPVIGIPCRGDKSGKYRGRPVNSQNNAYIQATIAAGGIPILIPLGLDTNALRTLYERVDGILLAGGGDINPRYYNEHPHETLSSVETERDQLEISLTQWAVAEQKPFLGICRGIQVMAVASGGTLWQDIPSQIPAIREQAYSHSNAHLPRNTLIHSIYVEPASPLAEIVGTTQIGVNSLHHQAIKDLPAGYRVTGRSPDGLIEAIDLPTHPFCCGVQWHPEEMVADEASARQLFQAFVKACSIKEAIRG